MDLTYPGILIKSCEMDSCKMLPEIDHRLEVMHLLGGFIITIEPDRLYFLFSSFPCKIMAVLRLHRIRSLSDAIKVFYWTPDISVGAFGLRYKNLIGMAAG